MNNTNKKASVKTASGESIIWPYGWWAVDPSQEGAAPPAKAAVVDAAPAAKAAPAAPAAKPAAKPAAVIQCGPGNMRDVLAEDLERIASVSCSDAASSRGESMTITLLPDDAESITITVQSNHIVQDIIQEALKLSAAQIRSVMVSLGGEAIEMAMCFEENGIEDGARLEVSLPQKATFHEVVQDMLELNPDCTKVIIHPL